MSTVQAEERQVAQTSPVRPEGVLDLRYLLDAVPSPDGMLVAYTVASVQSGPDGDGAADSAEIVVVDVATGSSTPLLDPPVFEMAPTWAPNGGEVAFRSFRSGLSQVHAVRTSGEDLRQLTSVAGGVVAGPWWSPTGASIAFVGSRKPPRDRTKPYRVTRQLWRLDGVGQLDDVAGDLFVLDLQNDQVTQVTDHTGLFSSVEWSPDGRRLLYVVMHEPSGPLATVRTYDVQTEENVLVYEEPMRGFPPAVAWLPDGRIVRTTTNCVADDVPAVDVVVETGAGRNPEPRASGLDGWLFGLLEGDFPFMGFLQPRIVVQPDGRRAAVHVQRRGTIAVCSIALDGPGDVTWLTTGEETAVPFGSVADGLLIGVSSMFRLPDLFVLHKAGRRRPLTDLNPHLVPLAGRYEVVADQVAAADGAAVDCWFLGPRDRTGAVPTVLHTHGGPHVGAGHLFSYDNLLLLEAGYGVVLVNQHGSSGYDRQFAVGLHGHWGELDIDDHHRALDHFVQHGYVDPDRLGVFGISAGGFLAAWLTVHSDRFKAGIVESPVLNWTSMIGADVGPHFQTWIGAQAGGGIDQVEKYLRCSPTTYAARCRTPTLIIQHELDTRTPPAEGDEYYSLLKVADCKVEMLRMPGTGHTGSMDLGSPVTRVEQNIAILDWFGRHLPTSNQVTAQR